MVLDSDFAFLTRTLKFVQMEIQIIFTIDVFIFVRASCNLRVTKSYADWKCWPNVANVDLILIIVTLLSPIKSVKFIVKSEKLDTRCFFLILRLQICRTIRGYDYERDRKTANSTF